MSAQPDSDAASSASVNGIERALEVLRLFGESDATTLGVTEIAKQLGMSKAVVHRVLTACRAQKFVDLDGKTHRYRLGTSAMYLGLAYLDRLDVRALGHDVLLALVQATGETATLSVRVGWSRVYIDQVVPDRDVRMVVQLGRPFPLHTGASSKAMLAFLPAAERAEYFDTQDLVRLTTATVTERDALSAQLEQVRERGYASSFGERDASAGSVAAPVFDRDGHLSAVISVSGPLERFRGESEQAAALLLDATQGLSQQLGFLARRSAVTLVPASTDAI